ncbi:MAG: excisionase family DNA-binding protein [Gemmataceae bacterium]
MWWRRGRAAAILKVPSWTFWLFSSDPIGYPEQTIAVMEPRHLSPLQVARILGVSQTTVKRWVDENRLRAHRTAGGHRRIPVSEVKAMVRRENWPVVDEALLDEPSGPDGALDAAALQEKLYRALLHNDTERARELVLAAHPHRQTVAELADTVIAPLMTRIGHDWAEGELDVFQEHCGTQVCLGAVLALKARLEASRLHDGNRPLAVGGGPEGDHYLLANVLVEMTLHELGWRVVNIGPNTPFASLRRAMDEWRPQLLWLSCSYLADQGGFLAGYRTLYQEAARRGVLVAVGGRALTEAVRQQMTYTHFGDRLAHLAAFVQPFSPRLAPPRDGGAAG